MNQAAKNKFTNYETFINSVILCKCFNTRLWHDSPHIFKQFNRIGPALSQTFVNAGIDSINKILQIDPRQLERILNKNQPFGNTILQTIQNLPTFKIEFNLHIIDKKQSFNKAKTSNLSTEKDFILDVSCMMTNYEQLTECENGGSLGYYNPMMFILGDEKNNLMFAQRLR